MIDWNEETIEEFVKQTQTDIVAGLLSAIKESLIALRGYPCPMLP